MMNLSCSKILFAAILNLFSPKKSCGWSREISSKAKLFRDSLAPSLISTYPPESRELFFPSAYRKLPASNNEDYMRGFCNWILPGRLMVGQYPGQTPEKDGPSAKEVEAHIQALVVDASIRLFVSLQSEIPPQNDEVSWNRKNGQIFLSTLGDRMRFPRPFSHYKPIADDALQKAQGGGNGDVQYIHWPIEDLSTPETCIQELLLFILSALSEGKGVYIHCWGGRGRAGLTAACLLSLVFPELDSKAILDWVQRGYDSRLGASQMPQGLKQSPQTETQRQFVHQFVREVQQQHAKSR